MPNPDYNPNQPESPTNKKTMDALKGVEFVLSGVKNDGSIVECKKIFIKSTESLSNIINQDWWNGWNGEENLCFIGVEKYKLRFKPYIYINDDYETNYIGNPYIYFAVEGNTKPIDNLSTHIYSTGYYGSTKRALQVDIDRSSTSLLGLYDFIMAALGGSVSGSQ